MIKEFSLAPCFLASASIHFIALLLASWFMTQQRNFSTQELISVRLFEVPERETLATRREPAIIKREMAATARPTPKRPGIPANETEKSIETKAPSPKVEELPAMAKIEGGGSQAGAGNLFDGGDAGVVPGPGSAGGGRGTAQSGLGRGSGTPGLPTQPVLKTNREAKPIQTAPAAYPPMALRLGLESDVMLKIEVDPEGKVTKAAIIKSGGAGFDEEALKAVQQSRFHPAQRDGQRVAAEFTFIYRFRLPR
jgi:TonB family protein